MILDTRKTTPLLRSLEKAAVRAGGGQNHRMGLYDAILIKENHVALAGGLAEAVARARDAHPEMPVEVECREPGRGRRRPRHRRLPPAARQHGPRRPARRGRRPRRHRVVRRSTLEASGGVALETVAAISATGVDFISVGALTHSAPALDLSMLLERRTAT